MEFIKNHFKIIIGVCLILLGILAFVLSFETGYFIPENHYGGMEIEVLGPYLEEVNKNNGLFNGITYITAGCLFILYDVANNKKEKGITTK